MNSDKQHHRKSSGNALVYVLIALALLGALTMLLSDQGNQSDDLSYEKTQLVMTKSIAFAASAKSVVDQMMMSGSPVASLDYSRPNTTSFDNSPYHNKVFHPDGGGFNLGNADRNLFASSGGTPEPGWYMGRFNNVEWTPTIAHDIVLAAYDIQQQICAAINREITGSSNIPLLANITTASAFVSVDDGAASNEDLTIAECGDCEGWPALCVGQAGGERYTYYNIISGR